MRTHFQTIPHGKTCPILSQKKPPLAENSQNYILHSLLKVPVHRTLFNLDKNQHLLAGKQLLKSPSEVTIQCQNSLLQSLPSVTQTITASKSSELYHRLNFCIKTCHIPSQKDKNPCIKVSNTRTCIHRLVFNTQRAQFTHWKDIPTKSSILTELQSLQISCPQSQRKLYSCRILFYIRSSQCISLQSLQNISALQSSNHAVTLFSCSSLTPRHLLIWRPRSFCNKKS